MNNKESKYILKSTYRRVYKEEGIIVTMADIEYPCELKTLAKFINSKSQGWETSIARLDVVIKLICLLKDIYDEGYVPTLNLNTIFIGGMYNDIFLMPGTTFI